MSSTSYQMNQKGRHTPRRKRKTVCREGMSQEGSGNQQMAKGGESKVSPVKARGEVGTLGEEGRVKEVGAKKRVRRVGKEGTTTLGKRGDSELGVVSTKSSDRKKMSGGKQRNKVIH